VYTTCGVAAVNDAALRRSRRVPVHVKVDTGMHRVGADPAQLLGIAQLVRDAPSLVFEGLFTHLAVADDPDDDFNELQLKRFEAARAELIALQIVPEIVHVANSAAMVSFSRARLDLVRCGIACYGYPPNASALEGQLAAAEALQPVLSLKAYVSFLRRLHAGERPSYGRQRELTRDTVVATVPIGYADGVPRLLGERGGAVLIRGRRCEFAGTVTMDQIVVDCGPGDDIAVGDEVVLIGRQGGAEITAAEWAERTGTLPNEILCRIGPGFHGAFQRPCRRDRELRRRSTWMERVRREDGKADKRQELRVCATRRSNG